MLLMSQRNVGTYGPQPVGNQQTLEAVEIRASYECVYCICSLPVLEETAHGNCMHS
jgi:hypothetical protein